WLHHATGPGGTAIGVAIGTLGLALPAPGVPVAKAIGGELAGPGRTWEPTRNPTTNRATIKPSAPSGAHEASLERAGRRPRTRPCRASSASRAADVRAHRSRGGSGVRIARSSARWAAYAAGTARHSAHRAT